MVQVPVRRRHNLHRARWIFALASARSASAPSRSQAWPPGRWNPVGLPNASTVAWILTLNPPLLRPIASSWSREMVTLHLGSGHALQVFYFDERGGHHARSDTNRETLIGIDLGKHSFHLHGQDARAGEQQAARIPGYALARRKNPSVSSGTLWVGIGITLRRHRVGFIWPSSWIWPVVGLSASPCHRA